MQTLFIISVSAFATAALIWFGTWALWIHPPEGWLGKAVVRLVPIPEVEKVRHAAWFRRIRIVTILLGLLSLALLIWYLVAYQA